MGVWLFPTIIVIAGICALLPVVQIVREFIRGWRSRELG